MMVQISDDLHHNSHSEFSWPSLFAHLTLAYPLFPIIFLYGEWLLAWWVLDHMPIPSADDPKFVGVPSWMHPVVSLTFLGLLPAFLIALPLNAFYLAEKQSDWRQVAVRIFAFLFFWAGLMGLLRVDPGRVVDWWLD